MLVRSGYFDVAVDMADGGEAACKLWCSTPREEDLEVPVNEHRYQLSDCSWDDVDKVITGTMWRVRENNLPSMAGKAPVGSPLFEAASFSYQPSKRRALIQYNHHGPRHTVLKSMLEAIGFKAPLTMSPRMMQDVMTRMHDAAVVRRIEYTLTDFQAADAQLSELPAVGETLKAMKTLHGARIRVEISMGHEHGGLEGGVKNLLQRLQEMTDGVATVKAAVKDTEEKAVEVLDLLGGRLIIDMDVREAGHEIDREDLRSRLRLALRDDVTTSDEETEEADDDADASA
jgi:hypothetical protein